MIQIGGVYATANRQEGILLQRYCDTNGRSIADAFQKYGGQGLM